MSNIIFISGTPCVGKTTIAEILSQRLNCDLIKINDFAISNDLVLGIDDEKGYKIIDIENLDILLNKTIKNHNFLIVEGHLAHLCSGADKVFILRCRPEILKERLNGRNYSESKIHENLEDEALGICSAEALELYDENIFELDVSDFSVDESVSVLFDVVNGDEKLSFGDVDFMDWFVNKSD